MKTRTTIAFVLISAALLVIGGSFKLLHWPTANVLLVPGSVLQVIALVALAKQLANKRSTRGSVRG